MTVSIRRLNLFLDGIEIDQSYLHKERISNDPNAVSLRKGTFYWTKIEEK